MGAPNRDLSRSWLIGKSSRTKDRPLERISFDEVFVRLVLPLQIQSNNTTHFLADRDIGLVLTAPSLD